MKIVTNNEQFNAYFKVEVQTEMTQAHLSKVHFDELLYNEVEDESLTLTSAFFTVLIMNRSSCVTKKQLPLFPGEASCRSVSLPQIASM
jgi:hypothetical protein